MIEVGLTAVADHPELNAAGHASTLGDIAQIVPVMEMDTTFYHIPPARTVAGWQQQVPPRFQFIVKATQYMTLHREDVSVDVAREFQTLQESLRPLIATRQLRAILFQFPPYFGVTAEHVRYFHLMRQRYPTLPIAVEFRNAGWYAPEYRQTTLDLLRELAFIHVVVDEPQTASGSVPLVAVATNPTCTIMRLHGRNAAGWADRRTAWRKERTNYRYSDQELQALGQTARKLAETSKVVAVIFNNNGHGDAATDAQRFIAQQGLDFPGLAPRQLDLF